MIVWVLVITMYGGYGGASPAITIIDNIESQASCERLATTVRDMPMPLKWTYRPLTTCTPVRKAKP